ncbi:hypothetical protein H696_04411 [Fonticula alba]|uniref:UNC-45/Cro1/She4 central domain-containing protein n=1 Tax=Fonticula alba TaxID=691883 RepID=A0A058Z4G5_FONAL|nr:hypothetical protein H696_04411 [Fonticula alba]KCV68991.1 hypothetical protein H696_04411 [Fonticula alba]|eukprot:XP_009496562.1 hypothetical protein H696_04411 [Fonticula alba]
MSSAASPNLAQPAGHADQACQYCLSQPCVIAQGPALRAWCPVWLKTQAQGKIDAQEWEAASTLLRGALSSIFLRPGDTTLRPELFRMLTETLRSMGIVEDISSLDLDGSCCDGCRRKKCIQAPSCQAFKLMSSVMYSTDQSAAFKDAAAVFKLAPWMVSQVPKPAGPGLSAPESPVPDFLPRLLNLLVVAAASPRTPPNRSAVLFRTLALVAESSPVAGRLVAEALVPALAFPDSLDLSEPARKFASARLLPVLSLHQSFTGPKDGSLPETTYTVAALAAQGALSAVLAHSVAHLSDDILADRDLSKRLVEQRGHDPLYRDFPIHLISLLEMLFILDYPALVSALRELTLADVEGLGLLVGDGAEIDGIITSEGGQAAGGRKPGPRSMALPVFVDFPVDLAAHRWACLAAREPALASGVTLLARAVTPSITDDPLCQTYAANLVQYILATPVFSLLLRFASLGTRPGEAAPAGAVTALPMLRSSVSYFFRQLASVEVMTDDVKAVLADLLRDPIDSVEDLATKHAALRALACVAAGSPELSSGVLFSQGLLDNMVYSFDVGNMPKPLQLCILDVLASSSSLKSVRQAIAGGPAAGLLRGLSRSSDIDFVLRAVIILAKVVSVVPKDRREFLGGVDLDTLVVDALEASSSGDAAATVDRTAQAGAIEALVFLSSMPPVKERLAGSERMLRLFRDLLEGELSRLKEKQATPAGDQSGGFAAPLVDSPFGASNALEYAVAVIIFNISTYAPRRSEEMEQFMKLREISGEGPAKVHPLDGSEHVKKRVSQVVESGLVATMTNLAVHLASTFNPGKSSSMSSGMLFPLLSLTVRVLHAVATDPAHRGYLVQCGAVRLLVSFSQMLRLEVPGSQRVITYAISFIASHALAKIGTTLDPSVAFPGERSLMLVRPLVWLLRNDQPEDDSKVVNSLLSKAAETIQAFADPKDRDGNFGGGNDSLAIFESLLTLGNLASKGDDRIQQRLFQENVLKDAQALLFHDNARVRFAACALLCNLSYYPPVFSALVEHINSVDKLRIFLAMSMADREEGVANAERLALDTRSAAGGLLAILSSAPAVARLLASKESSFLDNSTDTLLEFGPKTMTPEHMSIYQRVLYTLDSMLEADISVRQAPASVLADLGLQGATGARATDVREEMRARTVLLKVLNAFARAGEPRLRGLAQSIMKHLA